MFLSEAIKYNVLPLDDRRQELFNPNIAGRPDLMFGRRSLTLYEGMTGLLENDFINMKNTSFEIVADVEVGDKPANGVLVSQGGAFGGWSLYLKDGSPVFMYNYLGIDRFTATSKRKLPKGKSTVTMDFAYQGKQPGAGGTATLSVNGQSVGSGKIGKTEFAIFSADETASVGVDLETPVSTDYDRASSKFTGNIDKVTITLK